PGIPVRKFACNIDDRDCGRGWRVISKNHRPLEAGYQSVYRSVLLGGKMGIEGGSKEFDRSVLHSTAKEALNAFEEIAESAYAELQSKGVSLDSFASVNTITADRLAAELRQRNEDTTANLLRLCEKPAIARFVIEDEDGR